MVACRTLRPHTGSHYAPPPCDHGGDEHDRSWPESKTRSPRKIVVKGTSGAGKTTFAAKLARRLALPYVELDGLYHGPHWSEPTPEEFQSRVREAMAVLPGGWVIDGNYDSRLGDVVVAAADTVVWLDLPFPVKARWLWGRTIHRLRDDVVLWNGNRETWRGAFVGRDSLFVYMIRSHARHRREWPARFACDPRLVRLRSAAQARRWLDEQVTHPPLPARRERGAGG